MSFQNVLQYNPVHVYSEICSIVPSGAFALVSYVLVIRHKFFYPKLDHLIPVATPSLVSNSVKVIPKRSLFEKAEV